MKYSNSDLLGYAVITLSLHLSVQAEGGASCKDIQGRAYENGFHYIPGPEPCTLCVCDNGNPKWCKAVICTSPQESLPKQDCKSFRFGNTCCEFICLDDTLSSISNEKSDINGATVGDGSASYDLGLRLVASCITAILSLSLLFFLIHRLRQRKIRVCVAGRQSRQIPEEQRSLGSMGYLERGGLSHGVPLDDIPCGGGYPLWKPPGNYFPRGEAPPPYEEAVAAARAEQALLSISPHTLSPLNFPSTYLSNHESHASVAVVGNGGQSALSASSPTNTGAGSSSPRISTATSRSLSSPHGHATCYQSSSQGDGAPTELFASTSTSNFTVGTNTYENLPSSVTVTNVSQHSSTHSALSLSNSHSNVLKNYHTTPTRQSAAGAFTISATLPNSSSTPSHRTIPRTLATSGSLRLRREFGAPPVAPLFDSTTRNISPQRSPRSAPPIIPHNESIIRSDVFYEDLPTGLPSGVAPQVEPKPPEIGQTVSTSCEYKPPLSKSNEINEDGSFESVTYTCSMQALPTLHDDADDYRSECENCKSATGSCYYLDNEDELVTSPHETMTLHRRPEETSSSATPQYYRTSLTLPTSTRQRTRSTGGRGNWFSSKPESSSESSDDD